MGHFLHFFKEYLCAETKEIKRKAFATIMTVLLNMLSTALAN